MQNDTAHTTVLSESEVEQIHEASLALLEDPGVRFESGRVADLLLRHGAKRGNGTDVFRVPKEMVAESLAACPREVHLADRRGDGTTLTSESGRAVWSCPGMNLHEGGGLRAFLSTDMARVARLLHSLPNVDGVFGMAMDDIPPRARDVVGLNIMANNTSKHIRAFCFTPGGGTMMKEMKAVVGDFPWFSVGFTAHGPLRWTELALEIFAATSGGGIPVTVNGEPMAGTSGPVTLAGSAAVGNAEILAGIVAVQLLEPGRPCIYNLGLAHTFDMRTAIAVTGGPENALLAVVSAQMGRRYGLPSASWVSTESMCPDAQAALEKMFGFRTHMAAGVGNIWGVGQLESELTFSPAQAVIDNEMINYCDRFADGVAVDQDSLALDLTREVGIGGSFLSETHTAENFRSELFMPGLLLRNKRTDWEAEGSQPLAEEAGARAETLMTEDVDCGLSEDQIAELRRLTDGFVSEIE